VHAREGWPENARERRKEGLEMLFLLLAMALTDAQQAQHDAVELATYNRLQADRHAIADLWPARPSAKLLSDYRGALRCYVRFHLYKADGCAAQLTQVDRDLAGK
jgi:hypothetical protein